MADDMGYSDLGCFGSEIATPHINMMAKNGLRFSQMYNCARCCPSRASLLTGLYPAQTGIGYMVRNLGIKEYQGYLNDDCITIAEVLRNNGYQTGMSGKWHVSGEYNLSEKDNWNIGSKQHPTPKQRGFDRFYGILAGASNYFNPHTLMEEDQLINVKAEEDFYFTDAISEKAVDMIDEFSQNEDPFFLYVSYTAPHWPLHARQEDITKYKEKYLKGWDAVRNDRYKKLIEIGLISEKWKLSSRDKEVEKWEDAENKEWEDMRMAVYAAQIESMDRGVGTIIDKIKKYDINDNTIIIFVSDNGGAAELLSENGRINEKINPTRKGEKVISGNDVNRMPGAEDTFMSYDRPWANVSNTPFRLFKSWVHEGGISTPMVLYWPDMVKGKNEIKNEQIHFIDIMATLVDITDTKYPETFKGKKIIPFEGESFLPLIKGEKWKREKPIIWEHMGNCAVRMGKWKLVRTYNSDWELYNINDDRTELNDISKLNEEKVKELKEIYNKWAKRCNILPFETFLKLKRRKKYEKPKT